jgi:hypothetical protein
VDVAVVVEAIVVEDMSVVGREVVVDEVGWVVVVVDVGTPVVVGGIVVVVGMMTCVPGVGGNVVVVDVVVDVVVVVVGQGPPHSGKSWALTTPGIANTPTAATQGMR